MIDSEFLKVAQDHQVSLLVNGLTVEVSQSKGTDQNTKQPVEEQFHTSTKILNDVSFDLKAGQLMAIMGGLGSGKTTLLNVLSQRIAHTTKGLNFHGKVDFLNYEGKNLDHVKNSYMVQDDFFLPGLTVFETLKFQADLRLPANASEGDKTQLIDLLVEILELQLTRDTIVDSFTMKSSLSGGERRRVSLAIQLLSKPSVLFLDEPTTGLDSSSSLKLVETLKRLALPEFGLTIIMSIHQPRPQITNLMDKICLLTKGGRMVYYGSFHESASYFKSIDKSGNLFVSGQDYTMDYVMALSVKDTSSAKVERESNARIHQLVTTWRSENPTTDLQWTEKEEKDHFLANFKAFQARRDEKISFWREVVVLTKRTFLLSLRDKGTTLGLNGGSLLVALGLGYLFYKPPHNLAGVHSIQSALYVMLEVIGFQPMFLEIERLWAYDMVFFYREYKENIVSISGFLLSRRLGKLLVEDLPIPLVFLAITYFMWGLRDGSEGDRSTASYFFIYFIVAFLTQLIGMSTAILCTAFSHSYANANVMINLFYQVQNSACGYFVNAASMPVYVRWTKYLAYFWYGFGALNANQFTNWQGECNGSEAECYEVSGKYQLEVIGYPEEWIAVPTVVLFCFFIGFQFFSYLALRMKNLNTKLAKTKKNWMGGNEEGEEEDNDSEDSSMKKLALSDANTTRSMNEKSDDLFINLRDICLNVGVGFSFPGIKSAKNKTLLNNILASFKPNTVNAIMGPSGSGKSTLLNFLSDRLSNESSFTASGAIEIPGQTISPKKLAKISGYVTQSDSSLILTLTVRETLFFQARLRLPREEHPRIPQIVQNIIRRTGLLDCAETLVGSEYHKGISGGEKRRVSIAIQLLSRPKVLFLDEPTSGLDLSTAASILNLLLELAVDNSTTIITTIHQPSEEIFLMFLGILLLARGGKAVFNGPSTQIKPYFEGLGMDFSTGENIADLMLDEVTKKPHEDKETTDARISTLVENWKNSEKLKFDETMIGSPINVKDYYKMMLPVSVTLPVIIHRQFINMTRSLVDLISVNGQLIALGIIHALYYAPLKHSQRGVANRIGLLQNIQNLYFAGYANNLAMFPVQKALFLHEYADGVYGTFAFSIMYLLAEIPMEILTCGFFSIMMVFVIGLPRNATMFFTMLLATFTAVNCGESLGIMLNSLLDNLGLATNILAGMLLFAIFMAGAMSLNMPVFYKAMNYINPLKYAVGLLIKFGFEDTVFHCDEGTACSLTSGEKVMEFYHFNIYLPGFFGGIVACIVIYRLLAVALLYYRVTMK